MQLKLQKTETVQYFGEGETNQPDYRRNSSGEWESRFGEAWEAMGETAELEAAFVNWKKGEHLSQIANQPGVILPELVHALPL